MLDGQHLTFSLEEYQRRLNALRERMAQRQIDVVMINDPSNLLYLTGYQTTGYSYFQALVVPLEKEPFMVTRLLEETNITHRTWVEHSRPYTDTGDAIETLRQAFVEFGLQKARVAYEKSCEFLTWQFQKRLEASLLQAKLVDCSGIVEEERVCKSDEEIQLMKDAARATEAGMQAGIDAAEPGVTENDIAAEVHHAMFKAGGEYPAVSPYITSGPRTLIGHATWEGRTVQDDECVFLEMAGCLRRYHTAMMRTIFLGNPPETMYIAEECVKRAIDTVMKEVHPGMMVSDMDYIARSIVEECHAGRLITRSGYSIGIAFAPSWDEGHILSLKPGETTLLKENMTFHLIPWLYGVEDKHVLALSETIRITQNGAESFFDFPRQLFVKGGSS